MAFFFIRPGAGIDTMIQLCDKMALYGPTVKLLWRAISTRITSRYNGSCNFKIEESLCGAKKPLLQITNSVCFDDSMDLLPKCKELVGEKTFQCLIYTASNQDGTDTFTFSPTEEFTGTVDSVTFDPTEGIIDASTAAQDEPTPSETNIPTSSDIDSSTTPDASHQDQGTTLPSGDSYNACTLAWSGCFIAFLS